MSDGELDSLIKELYSDVVSDVSTKVGIKSESVKDIASRGYSFETYVNFMLELRKIGRFAVASSNPERERIIYRAYVAGRMVAADVIEQLDICAASLGTRVFDEALDRERQEPTMFCEVVVNDTSIHVKQKINIAARRYFYSS